MKEKNINWQKKIKKTKNAMKMYFIPFFDGYLRFHATINIIYQLPYSASGVKSLFVYIYIFSFFFFWSLFFPENLGDRLCSQEQTEATSSWDFFFFKKKKKLKKKREKKENEDDI